MNHEPPQSTPAITDLTGHTIGDYTLIRRLGQGGMADVYLADQKSLKRNVALKILKPDLAKDESYVRRFHREAQAAAALVQSNIVQIYEVGEVNGLHFIAQEYVQGRNLRQYLTRHGAVEPVMAINVLRQVGLALQKADEFGVIHRDIKPENIMLSTKGEVKVADFGLARVKNESAKQDLTQIGITMGTPLYMSPEQVEGLAVDSRSDIYSLGITVYHMLAGHPPFEGDNALSIALQHVKDDPQPLANMRPDAPVELCTLIHQMVAKSPDDRPSDASNLIREIRKIKIDIDEDWGDIVEKLSVTDGASIGAVTVPQSKLAVTRQLESVMKGNVRSWWRSPLTLSAITALTLLGLVIGMYVALTNPPADPLKIDPGELLTAVTRQENIDRQFHSAFYRNTEKHWESVWNYFPVESSPPDGRYATLRYHRMAKEKLAKLYIDENNLADALAIYKELAEIEDTTASVFRAIGWGGQAIIYNRMNDVANARRALEMVEPQIDQLAPYLRDQVNKIIKDYASQNAELNLTQIGNS